MKVTLDLAQLQRDGHITADEYNKLSRLAARDTGSMAFNVLVGLGVVAVSGAGLALVQSAVSALLIGTLLMGVGLYLLMHQRAWLVLANICILVAALMFGGGTLVLTGGTITGFLALAAIYLVCAVLAQSALLVTLSILAVVGAAGAGTTYSHALYEVDVERPLLTILICGAIALAALQASKRLSHTYERLCLIAARAALFFANMGFWVGSLFGDRLDWLRTENDTDAHAFVPSTLFDIGWAAALLAVGIWAVRDNRRWVVNVTAIFGSIHFYTQWFEHLSATPGSVLTAGLLTLGAAVILWKFNGHSGPIAPQPSERAAV